MLCRDAILFINSLNDVFSYYKAAKSHESANFLHHYARACGESIPSALRQLIDQAINAMHSVRQVLEGTEREAWEHFVAGYTQFHLLSPRYRLHEIIPEYY